MNEHPTHSACCAPPSAGPRLAEPPIDGDNGGCLGPTVALPGGAFLMGSEDTWSYPEDREGPVREETVDAFWIERCTVSNAQFAEFIATTGYVTQAERFGSSFVFAGQLPDDFPPTRGVAGAPWWRQVEAASWKHPDGPQSHSRDRLDHPVVHVSWYDAAAYCSWVGGRLPTEAEWEYAARGGLVSMRFPWGDEREPEGNHAMNVWQGDFPGCNTCADGWFSTAPVDAYRPNGFGLYNMCGNVWEWCADPFGSGRPQDRVAKGGSYLCHESYCRRYRVAARQGLAPDSTTSNVGFRCVTAT